MIVDCAVYTAGRRNGERASLDDAVAQSKHPGSFAWVGLLEPSEAELDEVATRFGLHPLAVEDALHAHQRPKLERYDGYSFLVVRTARYVDHETVISLGEVLLFFCDDFLISVRHGDAGNMGLIRQRLEAVPERLAAGPGVAVYEFADMVVDEFLRAIDEMESDIDEIQSEVFAGPSTSHTKRIFTLKREVLEFRQAATPLVEPIEQLSGHPVIGVSEDLRPYFRDVHDHLMRATQRLWGIDELLSGALDANMAQVSIRQNEDMRKISAWAAIVSVPTAIAGIYGMNFDNMPELSWEWGYPVVLVVIALSCFVLHRTFKRVGWL